MKTQPRILNGHRAMIGDFPWHASLVVKYRGNTEAEPTFCSGAILSANWILTTADCVSNAATVRVDVGSIEINTPLVTVYPEGLIAHPKFKKDKLQNNIALLHLSEKDKLNFDKEEARGKYSPVRLPTQLDKSFEQYEGYMSGFGFPSKSKYLTRFCVL